MDANSRRALKRKNVCIRGIATENETLTIKCITIDFPFR
jgi:hypothetical protein